MPDRLDEYRRKRDATRTPEPVPPANSEPAANSKPGANPKPAVNSEPAVNSTPGVNSTPAVDSEPTPDETPNTPRRFVIQQHHARSLHWDVRLERDGVLVSFAVPRGLPRDRARNNLARHTEDHPLEYLEFSGEIPAGEYGGGRMSIHDHGTYETDKWRDDEIGVTFHGERTSGRYVFFQ